MKTVVVLSDTHGNRSAIERLMPVIAESDFVIHLGDTSSDGFTIKKQFPQKTYLLNGNCDPARLGEDELTLNIEDVKIFACHGDMYGVKRGYDRITYRALELGCSVALFGHTHRPTEEILSGVKLFNPGTMNRYSQNTYLYLVINGSAVTGKICRLQ